MLYLPNRKFYYVNQKKIVIPLKCSVRLVNSISSVNSQDDIQTGTDPIFYRIYKLAYTKQIHCQFPQGILPNSFRPP